MNREEELLKEFVKHLRSRGLEICSFSKGIHAYWPLNVEMEDFVKAYCENSH